MFRHIALGVAQLLIAFATGSLAIYTKITDNGALIGIWSIMAAYGFTVGVMKLSDWRERVRIRKAHDQGIADWSEL